MDDKNLKEKSKKAVVKEKYDNELQQKIEDLEIQSRELQDQLARAVADYRNLEKRVEDDRLDTIKYANRELLIRLIPAFDTLFLAEKYVEDEGIKLTIRHLADSLKSAGVERVNTEGALFDPATMEVVTTDIGEENKILEELRPGFLLNGKVIRPAHVKVGKGE